MQLAIRRNELLKSGRKFVTQLALSMGLDEEHLRLLGAEESFQVVEAIRKVDRASRTYFQQSWKSVGELLPRVRRQDPGELLVVQLLNSEHFVLEMKARHVFEKIRDLVEFDGDLVAISRRDGSAGLVLDANDDKTVDVTMDGDWAKDA